MRSLKEVFILTVFIASLTVLIFGGKALFSYLSCFLADDKDALLIELKSEKERLRFELEKIETGNVVFREFDVISTPIYSRYPFSDRNRLLVAVGSVDGIETGMPAFTPEGFLLGNVLAVNKHRSEIKTIFDPSWSSSVAIGNDGVEAIIKGDANPKLQFIPEDAEILIGDFVYNTSPDYPVNVLLGSVGGIFYERGDMWQIAEVDVPYDVNKLRKVKIYLDFP